MLHLLFTKCLKVNVCHYYYFYFYNYNSNINYNYKNRIAIFILQLHLKGQYTTAALQEQICSVDCKKKHLDRAFIHHMQIAHLRATPQDGADCVHTSLPAQGVGPSGTGTQGVASKINMQKRMSDLQIKYLSCVSASRQKHRAAITELQSLLSSRKQILHRNSFVFPVCLTTGMSVHPISKLSSGQHPLAFYTRRPQMPTLVATSSVWMFLLRDTTFLEFSEANCG